MATQFALSKDDSTRMLLLMHQAAQGKHSRATFDFNGKKLRVVVYEAPDLQRIYQERSGDAEAGL